jgi:hypothetical protein
MDFSTPYSLRGDLSIENTSGKAEKTDFFAINTKLNQTAVTVSSDFALSLGKLVHHVCSQHGICHCIFSAHPLKYSNCKYID